MSALLAWLPPPALAERALGPDVGGGRPSLAWHMWNCTPSDARWQPLDLDDPWRTEGVALLLSLDGAPCALSIARACSLLTDATDIVLLNTDAKRVAQTLAMRLGGEVVEVSS